MLVVLVGCSESPVPQIPSTTGDFVKNDSGVGTAKVFGIDFSVNVNSSGTIAGDAIDANFVDVEKSTARKRFTIGDEITIQLDSIGQSEVRFLFDEQDFGSLTVGDKVVIDDDRNVQVNGTPRVPSGSE